MTDAAGVADLVSRARFLVLAALEDRSGVAGGAVAGASGGTGGLTAIRSDVLLVLMSADCATGADVLDDPVEGSCFDVWLPNAAGLEAVFDRTGVCDAGHLTCGLVPACFQVRTLIASRETGHNR